MGDRVEAVFTALADPSRRFLVERLAAGGNATPTELAGELPVSRQAVAKHLASLEAAGLVHGTRIGRNTVSAPMVTGDSWRTRYIHVTLYSVSSAPKAIARVRREGTGGPS